MELDKKEYYIIATFLALLIPLIVGVLFWWTVASVDIFNIMTIPEQIIRTVAITGLAIGILLDLIYLKKWIRKFYEMNRVVSILLYLFCSLMAVAFFMGIPIGNLFLGFLAGIYIGRKHHYLKTDLMRFASVSKEISLLSAFITSIEALPIGLLALQEASSTDSINRIFGFVLFHANKLIDVLLILILCGILFWVQFFVTRMGAKLSHKKFL